MPREPPVEKFFQTRWRFRFSPGVGYSQVTLVQSHSSSSATSWQETGERALAHFGAGDADHDLVVGMHHDPGVEFLDAGLRLRRRRC